ncbi:MAG: flagellar filament capping protein FliD [Succinivibrio sp.]|nr:flagellar filament capping protein FliD [Succinivibrio sp.]
MASTVTSAGTGSGNDFESIITASVEAKRSKYEKRTNQNLALAQASKKGITTLKSKLTDFQNACENLTKENSLNTRKVTTSQSSNYNCFSITTKSDCSNTSFDIRVTQLAKAESITQTFRKSEGFTNSFAAGKITIDLGPEEYTDDRGQTQTRERKFTVDVQEGDSLELIRKRLNNNDFDVNVSLIKTDDGYSFGVTSGSTGQGSSNIMITAETTGTVDGDHMSLGAFNFDHRQSTSSSKWSYKEGKDATIYIDGQKVTSKTNEFDDQISGISLVVNQLSEKETDENGKTGYKTYSVDITTDTAAAEQKMQQIVDQYNSLLSALDELSARDTYTDGKNNYDGGDLAGDSQVISIRNALQSMVVRFSDTDSGKSIFDCGLEFNKDGTLSINSSDFKDAMNNSFNSVVSLFTSEDGLLKQMSDYLEDYTQTGGILDDRKDQYQDEIDSWTQKANDNETKLEAYEAKLRTKYGNLDSLMASYNTSMSYISSILSST